MTELEQEIAHLQELRAKHQKNIRNLEEQRANYGLKPPLDLLNALEHEHEQLLQAEERLKELTARTGTARPPRHEPPQRTPAKPDESKPGEKWEKLIGFLVAPLIVGISLLFIEYRTGFFQRFTTNVPTPILTPSIVASKEVTLKTFHNRYVTAMGADWDWVIRAETTELKDFEKFTILCLNNGKVALETHHSKFVTAMNDQPGWDWELRAETQNLGDWEKFTLLEADTGKEKPCLEVFGLFEQGSVRIALKTHHGKFVTAMGADRDWVLRGETTTLNDWEKFTVIPQQ